MEVVAEELLPRLQLVLRHSLLVVLHLEELFVSWVAFFFKLNHTNLVEFQDQMMNCTMREF